jgi:hypothetical protein
MKEPMPTVSKFINMRILFTIILLNSVMAVSAQTPDSIAYRRMLLNSYKYKKPDGGKFKRGELKSLLLSQPESIKYYRKYRFEYWTGNLVGLGGAALLSYSNSHEIDRKYNGKVNPYSFAGAIVLSGYLYLLIQSQYQCYRAVKAYNQTKRPLLF